jgi:hypothetical protein
MPASVGFLLALLFNPEDRGCMFARNLGVTQCYNSEDRALASCHFALRSVIAGCYWVLPRYSCRRDPYCTSRYMYRTSTTADARPSRSYNS